MNITNTTSLSGSNDKGNSLFEKHTSFLLKGWSFFICCRIYLFQGLNGIKARVYLAELYQLYFCAISKTRISLPIDEIQMLRIKTAPNSHLSK